MEGCGWLDGWNLPNAWMEYFVTSDPRFLSWSVVKKTGWCRWMSTIHTRSQWIWFLRDCLQVQMSNGKMVQRRVKNCSVDWFLYGERAIVCFNMSVCSRIDDKTGMEMLKLLSMIMMWRCSSNTKRNNYSLVFFLSCISVFKKHARKESVFILIIDVMMRRSVFFSHEKQLHTEDEAELSRT